MKQFFTLCIFLVCKQIFSKCFFVANPAFGRIYGILIFMLAALRFSCAINIHNKRFDTKFFCIHLYFKLVMQKIPILIPINICNLIPINKISLFTAFTTWHCCRLHYCLGTFFWNYLYSNQQVWTSTFFLIFSYLVSSLLFHILEQTDRQTDLPTYQTGQTIVWKLKKLSIKSLLVAMLFWVSYFCFFARCINHIVVAGVLLCAPRTILIG